MAATKKLHTELPPTLKVGVLDVTLDSSYPAGGYPLSPADFGLPTRIEFVDTQGAGGYLYEFDYAGQKLKAYRQNATTGALVEPTGVDLSAVTVRCIAYGY